MTDHAVAIVGGGPTGLMLAGELGLAGIDVAVLERRPSQELAGSRAGGLHARTIEILDQRGIADRFVSEGQRSPATGYALIPLGISDFPTRHNYTLGLWQNHIERILADWVHELGIAVGYGSEVTGFAQDDAGVDILLADGRPLRAGYLVGCDGGRSVVRKTAGIEFPGWGPTTSNLLAEVEIREEPELGMHRDAHGIHGFGRVDYEIKDGQIVYAEEGPVRVMVTEQHAGSTSEPTLRDLSEALVAIYGTDYGIHNPIWITRFTDTSRLAAEYRDRRVLLAGDAAHVHSPAGGQGLNTGVQDAVNLGWKLAQVVGGTAPDSLLDSYHDERHPVAARVLHNTMAQTALMRTDDRTKALHDTMSELLRMDEPRKRLAAELSGLDIRYDLGEGHPLLGRRMPDLDLATTDGPLRVYTLLRQARPVLLDLGEPGGFDITPWADRVPVVKATYECTWELPVIGAVPAPSAVLVRPDGYVAWVGDRRQAGLVDALTTWFGPPTTHRGTGDRAERIVHVQNVHGSAGGVWMKDTGISVHGVRYQVKDVARAVAFYTGHLGFELGHQHLPEFANVSLGGLDLLLSGPGASGSRPMPGGESQEPGGWNRVVLRVSDLPARIDALEKAGVKFRNPMEVGPGGRQIQVEDPDGNPIELFEPAR